MLDAGLRAQLQDHFERLRRPVELVTTLDESASSGELQTLLRELSSLSPLLSLRTEAASHRAPSFSVGPSGETSRVRFAGVPLGHEFTSLILAILQAGGVAPKISPAEEQAIRALPPGHFETFVSMSCHLCPEVVQAFNVLALLNPGISHVMIDGAVFEAEVAERQIMAVPTVYRDGVAFGHGRMSLPELIDRLSDSRGASSVPRSPYDVLVIGGGPAGASAAVYAARKGIRTGLVAERFGGQVASTLGIENLISVAYTEGPQLVAALERRVLDQGVEVVRGRVEAVRPQEDLHEVKLASGEVLRARTLILAPGATWRELGVPGEAEHRTKGVTFCPHCDGPLFKGKRVAVIGGGNSGVEAAIDLAGIAAQVTLLEFNGTLRADAVLRERLDSLRNVSVRLNVRTTRVLGDGERVHGIQVTDRETGEETTLPLEGVFVQIGLLPSTEWLRGSIALTPTGEIVVDERGQTNVPGIFAAGDATTTPYKQIIIAMGDGARASLAAFEYLLRRSPVAA